MPRRCIAHIPRPCSCWPPGLFIQSQKRPFTVHRRKHTSLNTNKAIVDSFNMKVRRSRERPRFNVTVRYELHKANGHLDGTGSEYYSVIQDDCNCPTTTEFTSMIAAAGGQFQVFIFKSKQQACQPSCEVTRRGKERRAYL